MASAPGTGAERLAPGQLLAGHVYETRVGFGGLVRIESVGPKWITFRHRDSWSRDGWGPKRRVLRSGWEGPHFTEASA